MTASVWSRRPAWRPYVDALLLGAFVWIGFVLYGDYQSFKSTGNGSAEMSIRLESGVFALAGLLTLVFAGHWGWRSYQGDAPPVPPKAATAAASEATSVLAGTGPRYVLEVRGMGLSVDRWYQDDLWRLIKEKPDNYASVLSQDPKDYPDSADERSIDIKLAATNAFKSAAAEAVERWPLPVIVLGPPSGRTDGDNMAGVINQLRNDAGLGVTLFLWQDDANTSSAQLPLERLFQFFDEHPEVPAAMVFSGDGTGTRYGWKSPGMPAKRPTGAFVPPVFDSMVGLLVTRSDRVDKHVRPYAVPDVPGMINKHDTKYDIIKLWNFFWRKSNSPDADGFRAFFRQQAAKNGTDDTPPGVMKADWWIAQLPELWTTLGNRGPGEFKPSPYLPVRWTGWQVKEFDDAPLLGYLHRPVHIKLTDDENRPLSRAGRVKAMQAGWKQAVAGLPEKTKPTRVFYDTTLDRPWVITLTQALHGNAEDIDFDDVKTGYDIGRRVGNTGVSSALVQISLGLLAGYDEGGISATVNVSPDGYAGIVMVSPPDAASKEATEKRRGKNPFMYRVPGGAR